MQIGEEEVKVSLFADYMVGYSEPKNFTMELCLAISIAVKKYHDHSNSYKGKYLIEWLT